MKYDKLVNADYLAFRFDTMSDLWGRETKPVLESNGSPWMGSGLFMARSFFEFVPLAQGVLEGDYDDGLARALYDVVDNDPPTAAALRQGLDEVLANWAAVNPGFTHLHFNFASGQAGINRMKYTLNLMGTDLETNLADWGDQGMPMSEERAAVFSLFFEGFDIDDIMDAIIFKGDRQDAWYLMRYEANDGVGAADKRETALRRYQQSDIFELYDNPKKVSYAEAQGVANLYAAHRAQILDYENRWDPETLAANRAAEAAAGGASPASIAKSLQPAIQSIAAKFDLHGTGLEEMHYISPDKNTLDGDGNAAYENAKNNDDLLIGDARANKIVGDGGNDVIAGLGAGDRLSGDDGNDWVYGGTGNDDVDGGDGNDQLAGGDDNDRLEGNNGKDRLSGQAGKDELFGNAGNDRLTGGTGADKLVGGDGKDVYFADAADQITEKRGDGTDTLVATTAGTYSARHVEQFKTDGHVGGNISVTLDEFDVFNLSSGNDQLTLTINHLQKQPIKVDLNGGADTLRIKLSPGIDPSQVLDGDGVTARFDIKGLSANDTIDLSSIGIKRIVMDDFDIGSDKGFYLLAPHAKLHLVDNQGNDDKVYNNSTNSWFVVKCGDDTPYGPEFLGNVDKGNFEI